MLAWEAPTAPRLPGLPGPVRLYQAGSGQKIAVGPASGQARLYACGITPYDATHLGHAFTYVSIDLLVRAWRDAGLEVRYAQNVTDVDDPLLERAAATGLDWRRLAQEQTELYRSDMAALRVLPPDELTAVSEVMPQITATIMALRDRQAAYQLADPTFADWYFSVTSTSNLLDGVPVSVPEAEQLFAERGGDPERDGKRHRLDCLIWRQQRPGEPAWDTGLGPGRPGWHVGCTTIAVNALGAAFDVQAGGSDLAFPHHPMCAAEAQILTGEPFARAFLHTGMVGYQGAKMSKSLGNLVFVHQLRSDGADPMAVRLVLLAHHYRSDWEYTSAELSAAEQRLDRWRRAVARSAAPAAEPVLAAVRAALRDDLDAPSALAVVDQWAAAPGADTSAAAVVAALVDALLGVQL